MDWVCAYVYRALYLEADNAPADMKKPIYRHLVEQRWREDGPLDLLVRISEL